MSYSSCGIRIVEGKTEADVVVIGSGIARLCCAGLLSKYQQDALVLESHSLPGGAAHSFEKKGYKFDSGPSLFSGFQSRGPQANPLAQGTRQGHAWRNASFQKKHIGMLLRSQFCVQTRTSTIFGASELRNGSSIRPPVLKADSEATVETGIANTSRAMSDNTLYFVALTFHYSKMSN
ncbi:hypothetical protein HYC85_009880 [Camellia sinensis]|uniref:Amine oxidase domain-containing protein n=1 Tax=Camellia sinensis TaxID=4442 RepID=A0A7J7HJ45_CAMSI|nr:hypothetical protein HYC85_009880 [Camellia sinensis]